MKRIILLLLITGALILSAQTAMGLTAREIVGFADEAMDYQTAYIEARMVNTDRFGTKTIDYIAWAKGNNFLMEFTSDAEYGQKILRTEDRIYHFFPDSEAVFTKGKGDSVVGLISYDDLTDEADMLDTYDVALEGEEEVGGVPCYKISMRAKSGTRVAYPIQMVWIEWETYTLRRVEMFTRSGKPLKTMEIREVGEFEGRRIATDMIITDDVRRGVSSEMFIDRVELDLPIDDAKFTRRELTR